VRECKVALLQVLGIVAGVLLQDHDVRHTDFQQLPYHRIFIMLFIELNAPEQVLESINFEVLQSFWYTHYALLMLCDIHLANLLSIKCIT